MKRIVKYVVVIVSMLFVGGASAMGANVTSLSSSGDWAGGTLTKDITVTIDANVYLKSPIVIPSGRTLTIKKKTVANGGAEYNTILLHQDFAVPSGSIHCMFEVQEGGTLKIIGNHRTTDFIAIKGNTSWEVPTAYQYPSNNADFNAFIDDLYYDNTGGGTSYTTSTASNCKIYTNTAKTSFIYDFRGTSTGTDAEGNALYGKAGGVLYVVGTLEMKHAKIGCCLSKGEGVAIVRPTIANLSSETKFGPLTLDNVEIRNCFAQTAPALLIYNQMQGSMGKNNTAESCKTTITNSRIYRNFSRSTGVCGTIRTGGGVVGTFTMKSSNIYENYSRGYAAGLLASAQGVEGTKTILDGCKIYGNMSDTYAGGAMFSGSFEFTGGVTEIYENTAATYGGGLYVITYNGVSFSSPKELSMSFNDKLKVYNNKAQDGAGMCFFMRNETSLASGSTINLNIDGAQITDNEAVGADGANGDGGGILLSYNNSKIYVNLNVNSGLIKGNTAREDGGGIYCQVGSIGSEGLASGLDVSKCKVKLNGGTIDDNEATNGFGGGVAVYQLPIYCDENASGIEVCNNEAKNHGGGIFVGEGSAFSMNSGKLYSNSCTYASSEGGGIYCDGGTLNITGGVIGGENATAANKAYNGGGIFVNNSTLIMNNGTISHNEAGQNAGGIYVKGTSAVTFNNGTISGNTSGTHGGGVYVGACDSFVMTDGVISGNFATGSNGGGAFFSTNAKNVTISGGKIINNHAENGNGGGLVVAAPVVLDGGEISGNKAKNGGGISLAFTTLTINKGAVRGNTASNNGGGIYMYDNETTDPICKFYDGEISSNVSSNHGGGIYAADGDIDIQGGEILSNTCAKNGGGINFVAVDGLLNIEGGVVKGNQSDQHGGGIYASAGNVNFSKGVIEGNSSVQSGGGIYFSGNTFNLEEGQIINNIASWYGGGLCCTDPSDGVHSMTATISGGDVSYNEAKRCGGGIFMQFEGTLDFSGGNIIGNKAVNGGGVCLQGKADNNKGPEMTFGNGIIRNNIAKFDSSYSDDPFTTGCQMTFGWLNGVGGAVYLEEYASMKFDLTGNSLGIYANQADTMADDIFANGNGTSVVFPDVSAMDLTGYNSKTSELYWVEDYMTADTKYSSGTNGGGSGYSAKRYRDIIAEQGTVYKVAHGTYTGKYLALSIGHEIFYVTIVRSGLLRGENAVYRIFRWDNNDTPADGSDDKWVTYSELLLYGPEDAEADNAASKSASMRVALFSGRWMVQEIGWNWTYGAHSAIERDITGSSSAQEKSFYFSSAKKTVGEDGYIPAEQYSESVVTNDFGRGTVEVNKAAPASSSSFETIGENGVRW